MSEKSRPKDPATFRLVGKECGASHLHAGWAKTQVFRIARIENIDARQRDPLVRKKRYTWGPDSRDSRMICSRLANRPVESIK